MSVQSTPKLERYRVEDLSIEELRREYVTLKSIQLSQHTEEELLNRRIEMLREESVRLQQSTEIEEEHVANQLLRRLNNAERDVRKYEQLIHEEEEAMVELTKEISVIHRQQREVESELEKRQEEHIVLQGKLLNTELKKSELGRELLDEWQSYLGVLVNQLAVWRDKESKENKEREGRGLEPTTPLIPEDEPTSPAHPAVVRLEWQLNRLLEAHAKALEGTEERRRQCAALSERLKGIQDAAFLDIAQATKYRESLRDAQVKLLGFNPREGFC
ncbi:unnamed protein product [Phytomonas sp. Hart1]|nr:unnamed protein product [Phytomonas sp. Hart1]|eukprot:CCW66548.1 unnamed protein product [Phytomonas sp. isolate Hart1]